MGKTVWVIEDGCYSDYRVLGVFSSKENAELISSKIGGSIDEWELDPCVDVINKGYKLFNIIMLKGGTTESITEVKQTQYNVLTDKLWVWRRSKAVEFRNQNLQDCLNGTVYAKDAKHAIKIFNEKRIQIIANGEWDE